MTLIAGTARGKEELIEVMKKRKVIILGICETKMQENTDKIIRRSYRLINCSEKTVDTELDSY